LNFCISHLAHIGTIQITLIASSYFKLSYLEEAVLVGGTGELVDGETGSSIVVIGEFLSSD